MSSVDYKSLVKDIPDYPTKGVVFKDVTPMFASPAGFGALIDDFSEHYIGSSVNKVMGAEARGFLIGAPIAYRIGAGFVPARKPGKLPREVYRKAYELEYGVDAIEIHQDSFEPGDKVLIVDDLLATGGTALACASLVEEAGAEVVGFGFAMELTFLGGREKLEKATGKEVFSLIQVDSETI